MPVPDRTWAEMRLRCFALLAINALHCARRTLDCHAVASLPSLGTLRAKFEMVGGLSMTVPELNNALRLHLVGCAMPVRGDLTLDVSMVWHVPCARGFEQNEHCVSCARPAYE
jgi:hypothetical protein